jgi:TM2 domain-containing membrane protein YozV
MINWYGMRIKKICTQLEKDILCSWTKNESWRKEQATRIDISCGPWRLRQRHSMCCGGCVVIVFLRVLDCYNAMLIVHHIVLYAVSIWKMITKVHKFSYGHIITNRLLNYRNAINLFFRISSFEDSNTSGRIAALIWSIWHNINEMMRFGIMQTWCQSKFIILVTISFMLFPRILQLCWLMKYIGLVWLKKVQEKKITSKLIWEHI